MSRSSAPARGTLYVVGTPIGNLEDLSPRAEKALGESDLIACEDTRTTRGLLVRRGLTARLVSYHRFNEPQRAARILEVLERGGRVALVSDSGTPGISDPGALLVRLAHLGGHRVVPIPGPSAMTALLSASGFPSGPFTFIGFLPHRQGERRRALAALRPGPHPLLLFESPHRVHAAVDDALEILGDREAFLGREMTKVHEEFIHGTLSSIRAALSGREPRGEFALLIAGLPTNHARHAVDAAAPGIESTGASPSESPAAAVRRLVEAGWDRKDAMRRVARDRGLSRRALYNDLLREKGAKD